MKKNLRKLKNPNTSTFDAFIKFASFVLTKPGYQFIRKHILRKLADANIIYEGKLGRHPEDSISRNHSLYNDWINKKQAKEILKHEFEEGKGLIKYSPKISIVVPVYNPPASFLNDAITSVLEQSYTNWELCLADDASPNKEVQRILKGFSEKDKRIKIVLRTENGHISACSNSALELVKGEYILFMDHDDLLTPNCLFEIVKHINTHPQDELIYSDEDKIDDEGIYSSPHFKPDWAPDNLLSRNYIGHVVVLKKNILDKIGGFRLGYEGSQDYDLLLRATEQTKHIGHIPKILYHWRIHEQSVAHNSDVKPYAVLAAKKAIEQALVRRGTPGEVVCMTGIGGGYHVDYVTGTDKKVSIIIPTKDQVTLLDTALNSIIKKTAYPNYEIIVLNNNSTSTEFFKLMEQYTRLHGDKFRCIEANFPFNYSKLMNIGVAESKGEFILLLNNDVEIIHDNWMAQMVSYAQRKETGVVGVKLLYPDDTIQHAGVVLGFGGAAGHVFVNMGKDEPGYFNYIQSLNNFSALTGACIMFRKSIYNEVDGMDEQLDVEYNDVDLCLKIYEAGYYNTYLPSVEVYHHESATRGHPYASKASWAKHEENFAYFNKKWSHLVYSDPFYNVNLSLEASDFRQDFKK